MIKYITIILLAISISNLSYSQSDTSDVLLDFIQSNRDNQDLEQKVKDFTNSMNVESVDVIREDLDVYISRISESKAVNVLEIKNLCIAYTHLASKINSKDFSELLENKINVLNKATQERKYEGLLDIEKETELFLNIGTTYHFLNEYLSLLYENESYEEAISLINQCLDSPSVYIRSTAFKYLRIIVCTSKYSSGLNKELVEDLKRIEVRENQNLNVEYMDILYASFKSKGIIRNINHIVQCLED